MGSQWVHTPWPRALPVPGASGIVEGVTGHILLVQDQLKMVSQSLHLGFSSQQLRLVSTPRAKRRNRKWLSQWGLRGEEQSPNQSCLIQSPRSCHFLCGSWMPCVISNIYIYGRWRRNPWVTQAVTSTSFASLIPLFTVLSCHEVCMALNSVLATPNAFYTVQHWKPISCKIVRS